MTTKFYVLKAGLIKRFNTLGYSTKCERCGKKLKENDKIVSKISNRHGHNRNCGKRYHESCLKKLYFSPNHGGENMSESEKKEEPKKEVRARRDPEVEFK